MNLLFISEKDVSHVVTPVIRDVSAFYEVMEIDDDLKKVILGGGSSDEIEEVASKNGMVTILENGIEKALSGVTSLEEVIRVIKS